MAIKLDSFLIGIVIISLVTLGMGGMFYEITTSYSVPTESRYRASYDRMNESYSVVEDITGDVKTAGVSEVTNDYDVGKTMKAALNTIKVVFLQGLPTALGLITSAGEYLPIPAYILGGLQAILIISLVFTLVYLYLRYNTQ